MTEPIERATEAIRELIKDWPGVTAPRATAYALAKAAVEALHGAGGAAMTEDTDDDRETDQNGVEFGSNCLTPSVCHTQNLCVGTCKLF